MLGVLFKGRLPSFAVFLVVDYNGFIQRELKSNYDDEDKNIKRYHVSH